MRLNVLLAAASLLFATMALAQTDEKPPNMLGDWKCNIEHGAYYFDILTGPYAYDMTVEEQTGPAFKGYVVWVGNREKIPDTQIDRPGQKIVKEEGSKVTIHEEFLGMIGWGPYNLHMVDMADDGYKSGRILREGEIEFISARSGEHAAVIRTRCLIDKSSN
ncbi:MAG: hypothetical protein ABJN26_07330 [Stappiaceae bacterium]